MKKKPVECGGEGRGTFAIINAVVKEGLMEKMVFE